MSWPVFNAIADRGTLEFEAWFDTVRESDRSWNVDPAQWRFPHRMIPTRRMLGRPMRIPTAELDTVRPDLLICNYDRMNTVAGALASRATARRTALRCLPSFDSWTSRTLARETALKVLFRTVDGAKVPGPDGTSYARRYGLPDARTWPVTQSIDVAHYATAMPSTERLRRRRELGLSGCVFVYVGRIWSGKGLDVLLQAYRQARAICPDVSLLLVGDGVDVARLRAQTADLPDVVWGGFVQPSELPAIYGVADVLVFPTLGDPNGLVVEEAMAAGLPVVASTAAGDIHRRLPDGIAGYVTAVGRAQPLAERLVDLASNPPKRASMGTAGRKIAARYVATTYAEDFDHFVQQILATPRRAHGIGRAASLAGRLLVASSRRHPATPAPLHPPATTTPAQR